MGASRWDSDAWSSYSHDTRAKSVTEVFSNRRLDESMNPNGIIRESRDSEENPESTAVIIGFDVTGSMGSIPEYFVREGMGILFNEILDRKPVTDPHLMVMGIGDVIYDSSPLQVSQFEADLTIANELEKVHLEGGGGGNSCESYDLPYYFAGNKTSIDCYEKRGKRGYLFTIGDEPPPQGTSKSDIKIVIDDDLQVNADFESSIQSAAKMYNLYHIIIAEGSYVRMRGLDYVKSEWQNYLGQNVIVLDDYTKLSEVITSIIEINEGANADEVTTSWSGDTSLVVKNAVNNMVSHDPSESTGIITFD